MLPNRIAASTTNRSSRRDPPIPPFCSRRSRHNLRLVVPLKFTRMIAPRITEIRPTDYRRSQPALSVVRPLGCRFPTAWRRQLHAVPQASTVRQRSVAAHSLTLRSEANYHSLPWQRTRVARLELPGGAGSRVACCPQSGQGKLCSFRHPFPYELARPARWL
jgi:hypothetical protein